MRGGKEVGKRWKEEEERVEEGEQKEKGGEG